MTQPTGDQPRRLDLQKEDPSRLRGSSIRLKSSISSLVRRAKEAERQARTPVRPPRTPVRPARNHSESRDSGSRSPLSRSSSVESTARDESPLNFNAALNVDSKRALWEDEDVEGDSKKISAAQYEIFRQAVTSSKGTYKINPAKTKRAARSSLLDLGDTEVPDRVSWLDQPSLQDTMASTARIAQGLKEDEEVVKTKLSETLNDNTSSFKFFTVKQIFPREPYRLKIHRDALYAPKPPGDHGLIDNKTPSSYHLSHHVCVDTEELARRSAIYASLANSMVASVIEEFSPKDERSKLLRQKLTIIQEAQVSAVSAGFATESNLQLLRRDALLRNFNFQPQVLSAVRTAPFEGYRVVGPEPKVLQSRVWAIRQADRMAGSSVTFAKQKEVKTSTKTSSKRTVTQEPPFRAGTGRARPRPFQGSKKSGKYSSSSATKQRWRVRGGGLAWQTLPRTGGVCHRHRRGRGGHCIPATTSAHPSKHQFPDQEQPTRPSASCRCLADEGSHRASHQREVPGFLQSVVSGTQEDRRSVTCDRPVHSQPPHGSSTLQDGDARVRPISHQNSGVDGVDRHTRCLSSCDDASGCPQVSAFRGQQEGVPVHLSSVWTGDFSTGVHQAAETRRLAVEAARCEATRLLRWLADQGRYTGRSSTARPDNHQGPPVSRLDHQLREVRPHTKLRLPVHWDAVQHSTFHSGAPAENACKGPVSSSTLGGQSEHNCQRSAQTSRHAGVHGLAGPARTAPSSSSPMVGRHSMVPEDRELVRPDSSSTVGSVRGGMVVIPSSPARSTPRYQGDGSNSLHRCVQFGLGSPVRLTLDTGTVVSISKIVPHKRSGDAGCHLCCERLPTSSEVPSGATDVRQRSDGGVHQERGGHEIAHFDADDHSTAQVVRQQGDYVGSRPSARSAQHPGGCPVQSRPDTDHGVHDGHGESTTHVCQVGRTTDRYVCDIRQQTTRQVHIAISGPQGGVDRCHVHALGQGEGPLVRLPAIQEMVPQVLQKIAQSPGVQVILIAQLQPATSWFPELMDLSQEDPIPLFVEGQDLLTQDVCMGGGVTETRHFRPSNLHAWKLSGPFWERKVIPGKLPTWCQDAYKNLHNKCMNLIGQDSWRSVGQKDGTCFESEVIISVPIWCTSSGTNYNPRRLFHIARPWLLCCVIGCTIQQSTRTSSYWSGLSGWNVRCNAESCPSGIFIWFYCH